MEYHAETSSFIASVSDDVNLQKNHFFRLSVFKKVTVKKKTGAVASGCVHSVPQISGFSMKYWRSMTGNRRFCKRQSRRSPRWKNRQM